MEIKEALPEYAMDYVVHSERLLNSSETSEFIFSPRKAGEYRASQQDADRVATRWTKKLDELGWEKAWLVWDEENVVGHVLLRTMNLGAATHRAELQMGLEKHARAKGLGKELLKLAVDWAKNETNLEWIDLAVFDNNIPAMKIYNSFGFEETGRVNDMFRVSDVSLNNVSMSLNLKAR